MQKSLICLVIFTCLGVSTWAIDGVKGGHRPRYPTSGNQIGNNSTSGLCYITVPYSHVLALNSSGSPYNTIPQPPEGSQPSNSGFITILDCCDGYKRNVTTRNCEPHCDRGCFGGHCTGPNICSCEQGWRAEEGVCMPVCTYRCQENAYCFSPEVCVCQLGYDEINGECKPICPDGCRNGECVAPRVCRCRPGFVLNDRKECVPACEGGCAHGVCTAPGVCTCHEGYANLPNDRESCVPHCPGGCVGGNCVAPGQCNCLQGYSPDSQGRCNPVCTRGCNGGECVAPNVCRCRQGYKIDDGGNCVPDCPQGCINGDCVSPGQCICSPGYKHDQHSRRCLPNEFSTSESQCDHGYEIDHATGRCVPAMSPNPSQPGDCRHDCGTHGVCIGNRCSCLPGYRNDPDTGRCIPMTSSTSTSHCRHDCGPNGRCVAPNVCACNPGFYNDINTGRCVSYDGQGTDILCQYPCLNGQCTGPNQCTCNRGYMLDVRDPTRSRCLPVCVGGCANGVCTMPNFCLCNPGYRKESGVKGRQRCVPQEHGHNEKGNRHQSSSQSDACWNYCIDRSFRYRCLIKIYFIYLVIMKFSYIICVFCILQIVHTNQNLIRTKLKSKMCEKIISSRLSHKVPIPEMFREHIGFGPFYKNEMRWNFKNEFDTSIRTEKVCCLGYREVNDSMCEPICEPPCGPHGICIRPHICECDPGYSLIYLSPLYDFALNACVPECTHTCLHGNCTAPNVCKCNHGYSLNHDGFTCDPVCNLKCGTGSYCAEPDQCDCLPGYIDVDDDNSVTKHCKSICSLNCMNGDCNVDNICVCHDGYESDPDNLFVCKPKCDKGCNFGTCTAPNVCTCETGYSLNWGVCEPICSKPCVLGICEAPEQCNCLNGYGLLGNSSYICEPICSSPCVNGRCIRPDTCTCNEGYQLKPHSLSECKVICDIPCEPYGSCLKPNECTCSKGYRPTNQTRGIIKTACEPICVPNCINGECDDSGNCHCHKGYVLSESEKNYCEPVCKSSCKNGNCAYPGECICTHGYHLSGSPGSKNQECIPNCHDCDNGTCKMPYQCECFEGYKKKWHGGCKPVCTMCSNGICVAPEVCECNEGFVLEQSNVGIQRSRSIPEGRSRNISRCIPSCKNCDNGECVAPNQCQCHPGYLKIEDTCVYACESSCAKHGKCITEKRTCECNHGWIGDGVHCEPAMCVLILDNDESRTETLRIEKQDAKIEYILMNNPTYCPECVSKLKNTTLCFKMNINDTKNATQIGCLMDEDCLQLKSQYIAQKKVMKIGGIIVGLGFLITMGVVVIYILLRKYPNKLHNLGVAYNGMNKLEIMRILKSLVAILTTRVLLLEFGKWSHSEVCALEEPRERYEGFHSGICYGIVSKQVSQYVPYLETYRTSIWNFHRIKTRQNYRIEYHTIHTVVRECCKGYQEIGNDCKPRCTTPCEKGLCAAPDFCICDAGYQKTDGINSTKCHPVCANGCINGTCIEPDICKCNEDYWMSADGITCLPICDKKCERSHGFCSEPRVCSCHLGYRKTGDNECEPICERACTNGHCVAPDICKCADGYEADKFDPNFTCSPKCSKNCVFGTCTMPETCTCNRGYKAVNATVCEPICTEPCRMGVCVAPESCSCNDGYGLLADSKYTCEPICEFDCTNGVCIAPEICTCNKGFFYDNSTDTKCKPHCEIPCGLNGKCVSPNNCTCFEGYHAIPLNASIYDNSTESSRSICQPLCDYECVNGKCSAPNVCTCIVGYYPSWAVSHQESLSLNDSTSRICEPICYPSCGSNGICIAPDVCTCKDGYEKGNNGNCVPFCAQGCTNGTCTEPNLCTCNSGFESRNGSACEPVCERGCENGDCVAPNHCVCHDNFVENTGYNFVAECIPECTRNCSEHGMCVIEDEYYCQCYFGWKGQDCEEPTVCVVTMNFNHSDISRITISNDTSSATRQALADAPYCHQCDSSLSNKSLCYVVYSDEANATIPTVSCLLNTDLPCYTMPHYNASSEVAKIAWPVASIAALIAIGLMATVYLLYRKHQKNKLITGNSTDYLAQDSSATESLTCENAIFL
ncbi:PREDICTED: fibrillin-1-like [Dinoponera quadriceps]|uniref:Fibrillin-1-like n=1 Tax=Dinoponera quadriceps TaxID=609295 RepID=A0A6P3XBR1_DINQU|nr:PREDICTED: fibrillin-1-like [Dinoponera quadriceps]